MRIADSTKLLVQVLYCRLKGEEIMDEVLIIQTQSQEVEGMQLEGAPGEYTGDAATKSHAIFLKSM